MKLILLLTTATLLCCVASVRAADAKETWAKTCSKCHGANGNGETKMGKKLDIKNLTDAKVQSALSDEQAYKIIKEGVKDGDKTKMKPSENLSESDIKALVALVRTFKK